MTSSADVLQFSYDSVGKDGRISLTVALGDNVLAVDKLDVLSERARGRFTKGLCKDRAGIDAKAPLDFLGRGHVPISSLKLTCCDGARQLLVLGKLEPLDAQIVKIFTNQHIRSAQVPVNHSFVVTKRHSLKNAYHQTDSVID